MSRSDDPRARLAKVLPLLGSDKAGERDAAALAATRILKAARLSWDDLLRRPEPTEHREPLLGTWRTTCVALQKRQDSVRTWERKFVADLPRFLRISSKQRYILAEIADRVLGQQGEA
jgi:hypothetical protein